MRLCISGCAFFLFKLSFDKRKEKYAAQLSHKHLKHLKPLNKYIFSARTWRKSKPWTSQPSQGFNFIIRYAGSTKEKGVIKILCFARDPDPVQWSKSLGETNREEYEMYITRNAKLSLVTPTRCVIVTNCKYK